MEASEKERVGKRVTILSMVVNFALSAIKLIVGYISMSSALIADAVHSFSDLVTDFVCYFALIYSGQPVDEKHPYGHGRIESFGSAIIGIVLVIVGIGMIYVIAENLITGKVLVPTSFALYGALSSIIVKEALFRYTMREGLRIKSPVVIANAWDHRSDAISSTAALIGICGAIMGYPILDPIAALVVAAIIIKMGGEVTYTAFEELIDTSVPDEVKKRIISVITKTDGVRAFHDMKSRVVSGQIWIEVHVVVHPHISITEGHTISELVRSRIMENISDVQEVVVHCDAEDDQERISYDFNRKEIDRAAKEIIDASIFNGCKYRLTLHYLNGVQDLELKISGNSFGSYTEVQRACQEIKAKLMATKSFNQVSVFLEIQ